MGKVYRVYVDRKQVLKGKKRGKEMKEMKKETGNKEQRRKKVIFEDNSSLDRIGPSRLAKEAQDLIASV